MQHKQYANRRFSPILEVFLSLSACWALQGCSSPASLSDDFVVAIEHSEAQNALVSSRNEAEQKAHKDKQIEITDSMGPDNYEALTYLLKNDLDRAYVAATRATNSKKKEYFEGAYTIIALIERERGNPEREEAARELMVANSSRMETLYQTKIAINALVVRMNAARARLEETGSPLQK